MLDLYPQSLKRNMRKIFQECKVFFCLFVIDIFSTSIVISSKLPQSILAANQFLDLKFQVSYKLICFYYNKL